jgi:hypothetical protein
MRKLRIVHKRKEQAKEDVQIETIYNELKEIDRLLEKQAALPIKKEICLLKFIKDTVNKCLKFASLKRNSLILIIDIAK